MQVLGFKELREASRRPDLAADTPVETNLGFMAALLRQAHRTEIQTLTRSALQGLLASHPHAYKLTSDRKEQARVARAAVDLAELALAELEARGHVIAR